MREAVGPDTSAGSPYYGAVYGSVRATELGIAMIGVASRTVFASWLRDPPPTKAEGPDASVVGNQDDSFGGVLRHPPNGFENQDGGFQERGSLYSFHIIS